MVEASVARYKDIVGEHRGEQLFHEKNTTDCDSGHCREPFSVVHSNFNEVFEGWTAASG
jgi:hypothetical protein